MPTTLQIVEKSSRGWRDVLRESWRSYTVPPVSVADLKGDKLKEFFGEGYESTAGIRVTDENAYLFSAVYDAVNQSSADLAKLPLNLLKRRKGGGTDHYEDSKTYWLLKHEANPDMSAFEFRRTLQAHALTLKGGFAEIERNSLGQPVALWPITPDRIDPKIEYTKLPNGRFRSRLFYVVDGSQTLEASRVLHIKGLGYDGYCAYPVIQQARQAIGIALAAQQFAGAFFGNNATFGGVLSADTDIDPDQAAEIQDRIEKLGKGAARAFKWLVLGSGFKASKFGVNPQEAQMDDLRARQVEELARYMNFPLHKLKSLDRATNNNIEQQDLEYYKGHQLNWITTWEQELNRKLIPSLEVGNQYFKHNADAVLRADTAGRTAFYTALLDRGVFCADDVLALEDRNPQPDGQGRMFLVQGAMVPKDKVTALADATIDGKKQPPKTPAPAPPDGGDELKKALERAAHAEALVEVLRAEVESYRARVIALEESQATAELAEAREALAKSEAALRQADIVAVELRADVSALRDRAEVAEAAERALRVSIDALTQRAVDAERVAEERQQAYAGAVSAWQAEVERLNAQVAELRTSIDASAESYAGAMAAEHTERALLHEQLAIAERAREEAVARMQQESDRCAADLAAARAHADQAAAEVVALRGQLSEAERVAAEAAAGFQRDLRAAEDRAVETATALDTAYQAQRGAEAAVDDLRSQLSLLEQSGDLLRAELASARAIEGSRAETIAAFEQSIARMERERVDLLRRIDEQAEALTQTRADVDKAAKKAAAAEQVEAETTSALIAAMRSLAHETMRRMVEREAERARGKGQRGDKLAAWMGEFYAGHAEVMRNALLPVVRVHLAFIRSVEDPVAFTGALVDEHVKSSTAQLRGLLDGDEIDLASALNRTLYRWEQERAAAFADQFMRQELESAGLLEQSARRKRRKVTFQKNADGAITGATVDEP